MVLTLTVELDSPRESGRPAGIAVATVLHKVADQVMRDTGTEVRASAQVRDEFGNVVGRWQVADD